MPIFFAAVVASIKNLYAVDFNEEHGCTQHVSGPECRESNAISLDCLVVVDQRYF
jgi:hypothetical protein